MFVHLCKPLVGQRPVRQVCCGQIVMNPIVGQYNGELYQAELLIRAHELDYSTSCCGIPQFLMGFEFVAVTWATTIGSWNEKNRHFLLEWLVPNIGT